ncbi:MAG: VacB/RNase II family 3'-5' exoribonuclease [Planctomycetota bacterium]|nr:VacB/RNase II family 3'-5' exoribonuclease [Planctomycetota bacterium]
MKLNQLPDQPLAKRIIDLVYSDSYRPSKPKGIHKLLGLDDSEYPNLRRTIKSLVQSGQLTYATNHLILKPGEQTKQTGSSKKTQQGTFRAAAGGYGFVRLSNLNSSAVADDVFIPAKATGTAMEGDIVAIRILSASRDGRSEGTVEEVVQRAKREFVGTYQLLKNQSVVWLDGVVSENPVLVGDVRGLPINPDDKVIVEMVRYPDAFKPGEAVIMKVLGTSMNPAVDTIAVMHQFGLIDEFPEAVLDQARDLADKFNALESEPPQPSPSPVNTESTAVVNVAPEITVVPEAKANEHLESEASVYGSGEAKAETALAVGSIFANRTDLTRVPTLTIDPTDARDFDDAVSLSMNSAGHWELMVHIADVAHFVPEGSILDDEARRRATSVYLPDKVIPMLPEIISNHLASLQPDRMRLSKTVKMEMTIEGTMIHTEVFNSVIKNAHRFNYEQVDQFLEDRLAWEERLTPEIFKLISEMHILAMVLRNRRMKGGSIELTLPEVKIDLDKLGKVKGAHLVHHTQSHQIIEEFMLAANQAVATYLDDLELPLLRRAHAPPQRMKLKRLKEFVTGLGIECGDLQDRFEIQRVIESVKGQPTEQAVNFAVLKSMSKAVYQPQEERHYALDMTHYCHFTSPIRRYPDLVVHRIIQKVIDGKNAVEPFPVLSFLGQHCSDREVNAEYAERELIRVKLLHFMSKRVNQEFDGTITAVKSDCLIVRLHEVPVDGKIPVERLPSDRYRFDRQGSVLEGFRSGNKFRLGDTLQIRVEQVDIPRRELYFDFVSKLGSAPDPKPLARRVGGHRSDDRNERGRRSSSSRGSVSKRTGKPFEVLDRSLESPVDSTVEKGNGLRQFDRRTKKQAIAPPSKKPAKRKKSRPGKSERQKRKSSE